MDAYVAYTLCVNCGDARRSIIVKGVAVDDLDCEVCGTTNLLRDRFRSGGRVATRDESGKARGGKSW